MCEIQNNCGFYKHLIELKKIPAGSDCPKPDPKQCPRYRYKTGEVPLTVVQSVFNIVTNPYTTDLPLSQEETKMYK